MTTFAIRNIETGEVITLSRDVRASVPAWVYAQTETETPSDLQGMLDQYDPSGIGQGEDNCGITMES